jgi:hypothetical protein
MFLILKSMPIVVINVGENESLAYRRRRHVFPTPLSPIISNLICISKELSLPAIVIDDGFLLAFLLYRLSTKIAD